MRKLLYIILSFSLIFSPIFAYAGLPQSVTDYAVTIKNVVKNGVGVAADFAFKKKAANDSTYQTIGKSVSNGTLASSFMKRFLKFGAGAVGFLVIEKLLEGTDWVISEGTRDITRNVPNINNYAFCTSSSYNRSTCYGDPAQLISSTNPDVTSSDGKKKWTNYTFTKIQDSTPIDDVSSLRVNSASLIVHYKYTYHKQNADGSWDSTTYPNTDSMQITKNIWVVHAPDTYTLETMTDAQLASYLNRATADDLSSLLQPQPNVDPAEDPAYADLYAPAAAEAEPIDSTEPEPEPEPEPDPDPDPNTGQCPSGYTKVENLCIQKAQSTDFPDFCSWATPVCDFVDWFSLEWSEFTYTLTALKDWFFEDSPSDQNDDTIDTTPVPVVPAQVSIDFVGGCPAPLTFEFSIYNQTFRPAIPFDPVCEVAILINPIIKICSTIASVYIIAGIRQGSS